MIIIIYSRYTRSSRLVQREKNGRINSYGEGGELTVEELRGTVHSMNRAPVLHPTRCRL